MTIQRLGCLGVSADKVCCDVLGFRLSDYIRTPIAGDPQMQLSRILI